MHIRHCNHETSIDQYWALYRTIVLLFYLTWKKIFRLSCSRIINSPTIIDNVELLNKNNTRLIWILRTHGYDQSLDPFIVSLVAWTRRHMEPFLNLNSTVDNALSRIREPMCAEWTDPVETASSTERASYAGPNQGRWWVVCYVRNTQTTHFAPTVHEWLASAGRFPARVPISPSLIYTRVGS